MSSDGAAVPAERSAEERTKDLAELTKERIYATITMVAVLLGLTQSDAGYASAALTVTATALGLWLATVVADLQAHRAVYRHIAHGADLRHLLYLSSPLLVSALGPLVFVGISALSPLSLPTALYVAVAGELATLFLLGLSSGRRMGNHWLAALVVGALDLAIGLAVVGIKLLAAH